MNPLLAAGGAALLLLGAASIQTWRLGNAQERIGALQSGIQQCAEANRSQMQTLEAIRKTQAENEAQRVAALEAQREASERARELQQELDQRGSDDIQAVERTPSDCADTDAPRPIVVRVTSRGSDTNADGRSNPGTPGSGQQ